MRNQWLSSFRTIGQTGWAGEYGGLPGKEPIWVIPAGADGYLMAELCMTEQVFYVKYPRGTTKAIDAGSGRELWRHVAQDNQANRLELRGDFLLSGWFVLDSRKGTPMFNLYEQLKPDTVHDYGTALITDREFLWGLNEPDARLYRVERGLRQWELLGEGFAVLGEGVQENTVICLRGMDLVCLSVASREFVWTFTVPKSFEAAQQYQGAFAAFALSAGKLYLLISHSPLLCIDSQTGRVCWKHEPSHEDLAGLPHQQPPTNMLVARNRIYLINGWAFGSYIECHDIDCGALLWRKILSRRPHGFCGCGDLLFGKFDDDFPVALDRHTGEIVWQAAQPMEAAYGTVSGGTRVVYTSTTGEIQCYEWTEEYHSPARPTA